VGLAVFGGFGAGIGVSVNTLLGMAITRSINAGNRCKAERTSTLTAALSQGDRRLRRAGPWRGKENEPSSMASSGIR
jgi:hypothetical protein